MDPTRQNANKEWGLLTNNLSLGTTNAPGVQLPPLERRGYMNVNPP